MLGLYEAMHTVRRLSTDCLITIIQGEPRLHGCASPLVHPTTHLYKSSKVVLLRYRKKEKKGLKRIFKG